MSDLLFFKDDALIYRAKEKAWKKTKQRVFEDTFELKYSDDQAPEFTDMELSAMPKGSVMLFDVECFKNYFLAAFRSFDCGKVVTLEHPLDLRKLDWIMRTFCIVGFNSKPYDIPMLQLALKGASTEQLFKASCQIIQKDMRDYDFRKVHKLPNPCYDHIDLIEVAPLAGSLKVYAGRLHTARMQDLPIDPMEALRDGDKREIKAYCCNDLVSNELMVKELEPQINLRVQMSKQYDVDLRSKSDAQIAEAVIGSEIAKLTGSKCKRPDVTFESHKYNVPSFVGYRTPVLRNMLEIVRNASFSLDGQGYIDMPPEIASLSLALGQCVYKMGIGGLHSTEKKVSHVADDDTLLLDIDVESFYPKTILNQRLFPKHLGIAFLRVYKSIVDRRLDAKHTVKRCTKALKELKANPYPLNAAQADALRIQLTAEMDAAQTEADSLKITINGLFGKLGNRYSLVYAPDLMIQVTITGQLVLLMLIEMIEDLGISVVSANTDGVLVKCPKARYEELQARVAWWESLTDYKTEETRYKGIWAADVNNYFAHKDDGKAGEMFKIKGRFGEKGSAGNSVLSKNPENLICSDAIMALIEHGTPVADTIRACKDIRRFVTLRRVTGGARKSQTYLGKVIRWYYSTEMKGEINRVTSGDKVPNSDGARPLMELPKEFPTDIDYSRYIEATNETLYDIGYYSGISKSAKRCLGPLFVDDTVLDCHQEVAV